MNQSQISQHNSRQARAAAIQLVLILLSFLPVLCLNWMNTTEDTTEETVVTTYPYGEAENSLIRP